MGCTSSITVTSSLKSPNWLNMKQCRLKHFLNVAHCVLNSSTDASVVNKFVLSHVAYNVNITEKQLYLHVRSMFFFQKLFIYNTVNVYNTASNNLKKFSVGPFKSKVKYSYCLFCFLPCLRIERSCGKIITSICS